MKNSITGSVEIDIPNQRKINPAAGFFIGCHCHSLSCIVTAFLVPRPAFLAYVEQGGAVLYGCNDLDELYVHPRNCKWFVARVYHWGLLVYPTLPQNCVN